MRKLLCLLLVVLAVGLYTVSASETKPLGGSPKLVAKTTYDIKYVPNKTTGKLQEVKTPKKQLFQVVMKKTKMTDPTNPAKSITVDVPTEIPYVPNRKASGKLQKLKARFQALKKREHQLKAEYASAHSKMIDNPVVEDGAPAPPDPQMVKMAQDLYDELEATQFPKAKNIQEHIIRNARQFAKDSGSIHEKTWDMFWDMKKKKLVPEHGWGMTM